MNPSKEDTSSAKPSATDLDSAEMGSASSKVKSPPAALDMGSSKKDSLPLTLKISLKKDSQPFSGLVIGVSGRVSGYTHATVKDMVENAGAKFSEDANLALCTHLLVDASVQKTTKKMEEAKEQDTCEVVYFTWLLKSIKQGRPLSAERYRVWRERDVRGPDTEGNKIKTVGKGSKKRKLEYDMEHEVQDTWSRRLEEWAIMASLVSLVDPSFIAQVEQSAAPVIFMEGNVTFDAMLLLYDIKSKRYTTWVNNYLTPKIKAESDSVTWGDWETARSAFEKEFKLVSGLSWKDRHSEPKPDKFIFITCKHKSKKLELADLHPGATFLTLSKDICNALNVIVSAENAAHINSRIQTLSYSFTQVQGSLVERQRLEFGARLLTKLSEILGTGKKSRVASHADELSRLYRQVFSHSNLTRGKLDLKRVQCELEDLNHLLNLTAAQDIVTRSVKTSCDETALQIHQVLGLKKFRLVSRNSLEYEYLAEYFNGSFGTPHVRAKINNIFRIERPSEVERFSQWRDNNQLVVGTRRLLWHGSHSSNFIGILNQGLRTNAQGYGYGNPGIFFADFAGKSFGFCRVYQSGTQALMLLCEVELGKREFEGRTATIQSLRSEGCISRLIKGQMIFPTWKNAKCVHEDLNGILMPDVTVAPGPSTDGVYGHNEYVVYEPSQILQRYLFHIEMC